MRWARLGARLLVIAAIVLVVWVVYLNIHGRPQTLTSVALGGTTFLIVLMETTPLLRPPRPPDITVTNPDALPGSVYGHDAEERTYTRDDQGRLYFIEEWVTTWLWPMPLEPPPPRWWNGPGRMFIIVNWLARASLSGFVAYYSAGLLDRGFNLTLLELAAIACALMPLRHVAKQLAGFPLTWDEYRHGAGARLLARAVVAVIVAGYAFVIADFVVSVAGKAPRAIYRALDGLWHLPWLNVPIVVVTCFVGVVVLATIAGWARAAIAWLLGPGSASESALDELPQITVEGDPRIFWRLRRRRHSD